MRGRPKPFSKLLDGVGQSLRTQEVVLQFLKERGFQLIPADVQVVLAHAAIEVPGTGIFAFLATSCGDD
jgi:hypothetical protein